MNNLSNISHTSHHYFIGYKIKNSKDISKFKKVQDYLFNKNNYLSNDKKLIDIYTPFVYLGYLNESVERKLSELYSPVFNAIGDKFGSKKLYFDKYILQSQSNKFKYFAINFETVNSAFHDVIIPYLKKVSDDYTEKDTLYEDIPIIPLALIDKSLERRFLNDNSHTNEEINNRKVNVFNSFKMPTTRYNRDERKNYIEIDSIELLRATTINVKRGAKSFNDKLKVSVVMSIPLTGNN